MSGKGCGLILVCVGFLIATGAFIAMSVSAEEGDGAAGLAIVVVGLATVIGGAALWVSVASNGRYNLASEPIEVEKEKFEDAVSGKVSWADYMSGLEKANK